MGTFDEENVSTHGDDLGLPTCLSGERRASAWIRMSLAPDNTPKPMIRGDGQSGLTIQDLRLSLHPLSLIFLFIGATLPVTHVVWAHEWE